MPPFVGLMKKNRTKASQVWCVLPRVVLNLLSMIRFTRSNGGCDFYVIFELYCISLFAGNQSSTGMHQDPCLSFVSMRPSRFSICFTDSLLKKIDAHQTSVALQILSKIVDRTFQLDREGLRRRRYNQNHYDTAYWNALSGKSLFCRMKKPGKFMRFQNTNSVSSVYPITSNTLFHKFPGMFCFMWTLHLSRFLSAGILVQYIVLRARSKGGRDFQSAV